MNPYRKFTAFFSQHWPLALVIALAAFVYLHSDKFAEFLYGGLRLGVVVLVAFLIISLVFHETIRPYMNSGDFVADFRTALSPERRFYTTLAVIAFIVYIAADCFTHA